MIIGVQSGVFDALVAEPRPFNSTELSEKTGVSLSLLSMALFPYNFPRSIDDP